MKGDEYPKMKCPNCSNIIDYVEEIGSSIIEGSWKPVILAKPETHRGITNRKVAFGSSGETITRYYIRCPKCKGILLQRNVNHETIAQLTHAMVCR